MLVSTLMFLSISAFAGAHGGRKVDCGDPKNKDNKECVKK